MASQRPSSIAAPRSAPGSAPRGARSRQQLLRADQTQPLATLEIVERATAGARALRAQDALRVWKALGSYIGAQLLRQRAVRIDGFGIFALNVALEPIFLHATGFLQTNRVRESRARTGGVLQVIGSASEPIASVNMGDVGRDFLPGYSKDVVATVVTNVVALAGKLAKQGRVLRLSLLPMGEWICDGDVVSFQFLAAFRAQTKLLGRMNSAAKIGREQPEHSDKASDVVGDATRAPEPASSLSADALVAHALVVAAASRGTRASVSRHGSNSSRSAAVPSATSDGSAASQCARNSQYPPAPASSTRQTDVPTSRDARADRLQPTHMKSIASATAAAPRAGRAHTRAKPSTSTPSSAARAGSVGTHQDDAASRRQAWGNASSNSGNSSSSRRSDDAAAILARVKTKLVARCGPSGLNALARVLASMDASGDGVLSPHELKFGLRDLGIELTVSELAQLLAVLDRNRDGDVDARECVAALRGSAQMSGTRLALVHRAFTILDPQRRGATSVDALRDNYDVSLFPAVRAKRMSKQQALDAFVRQWEEADGCSNGACIPLAAFIEYYENVSACIADDSDFALLMRQTWHVSLPADSSDEALDYEQQDTRCDPSALTTASTNNREQRCATDTSTQSRLATASTTAAETEAEQDWRLLRALLVDAGMHASSKTPTVDDVSRKLGANRVWGDGNEALHTTVFARALAALARQLTPKDALLLAQRVVTSVASSSAHSRDSDDSVALVALHRWLLRPLQARVATGLPVSEHSSADQLNTAVDRVRHRLLQRIVTQQPCDSSDAPAAARSSGVDSAHVGLNGLQRSLKLMDTNGDKRVSKDELQLALRKFGVDVTFHELDHLFTHFDADRSGCIGMDEFLVGMRGAVSARRLALVALAFNQLDRDGDGVVTLQELAAVYDTSKHPDVLSGRLSPEAALAQFAAQWERATETDGVITRREFEDYYTNVSASIDSDDYFELMLRNAWHLAGGDGVCANSTNRRVLVTDADGNERICTIQNDLGIRPGDYDTIRQRLAAQGEALDRADKRATIGVNGGIQHEPARQRAPPPATQSRRALEGPLRRESSQSTRTQAKTSQGANSAQSRVFHRRRVLERGDEAAAESASTRTSSVAKWTGSSRDNSAHDATSNATSAVERRALERDVRHRAAQLIQNRFRGFKARKFVQCVRRKLAAETQRRERLVCDQLAGRKKVLRAALKTHHGF